MGDPIEDQNYNHIISEAEREVKIQENYTIEKIYFILDYEINSKREESKNFIDYKESRGIINMEVLDQGVIIKDEMIICEYDVFCVSMKSTHIGKELKINYEIDGKVNDIILSIPKKKKYNFIFDQKVKLYHSYIKIIYNYEERKYKSSLSELDKLILFKRAIMSDDNAKKQLIEEGLLLFNKNINYYILLYLFCMSPDKQTAKVIIDKF